MIIDVSLKAKERNRAPEIGSTIPHDTAGLLMTDEMLASLGSESRDSDTVMSLERTLKEAQDYKSRLDLLYKVGRKVGSVSQLTRLVGEMTRMTQRTLNASASSVLLLDDQTQELLFEVAEGQAGKRLRRIRLSGQSGIAGWVVHHCKPLIVDDVSKDGRFNEGIDEMTGFSTKSIICVPLIVHSKTIGVIEVLNKVDGGGFTAQDLETLISVASTAAVSIENVRLNQTLLDAYKSTIKALAAAIDAKDPYTCGHSQQVTEYALLGASSLSFSEEELENIEYAGILHDIGKIGIADSILNKPAPLTTEERYVVQKHSMIGANMLKEIPFLEKARRLVLHHHERYDGKGYPDGLKGEAIPMGARLLAVADSFDAMTSDRTYRAALSVNHAISELERCSGTQFCTVAVDAFVTSFRMKAKDLPLTPRIFTTGLGVPVRG